MKKSKHITLLSGREDRFYWGIGLSVERSGEIRRRNNIEIVNYEVSSEEQKRRNKQWKIWCAKNKEGYNRKRRARRAKNPELYNQKKRKYYAENKEQIKEKTLRPERHKRRQKLGYIPLNKREDDNWEGHHLSEDIIVHIPHKLHRSVKHNVFTGEGIADINGKVLVWAGQYYSERGEQNEI